MTRKPGSPGDADSSFGFLLHDVARLMRRNFNHRVQGLGLTQAQYRVILHLSRCEGIQQVALAELLEIQPITLARLLDKLEASGIVERRKDPRDRRAFCLYLTPAAHPVLETLWQTTRQTRKDATGVLGGPEMEPFVATLKTLKENLLQAELTLYPETRNDSPRKEVV